MLSLFHYEFVQNAFLGATIVAIVASLVGYFVVLRAQAFAAEALTDIGFAGATGAAILGFGALIGMLILSLLSALGMGALGERMRGRDIEIGMVLSFALGLGVLFLSLYTQNSATHASAGIGILFGSIFSITRQDILITLLCGILILLVLALIFRPLLFASIDPEIARTRGVPVRLLSVLFLLILAATAAESVLVVGVLLVSALLIAPAATAERLTHRPLTSLILSVCLSLGITWSGLLLSFAGTGRHLPAGFYISALAALSYFAAVLFSRKRLRRRAQRSLPA
ncbi:metal ABC transporter permease [Ktedonosporobacter rubrisoli]|uniref:Metal ABC transporter permease n=1 Tax=Ktedonosporobacter rubrisoli TaxID=2509675 RepID=A0A4P6JHU7_KTERU|nr:metal ABC transporter permease [Ktedonosporobacter rubrisoli]QBD74607.1 metal ABC transporter permease [Ktedonosporobacter rubrisoli]